MRLRFLVVCSWLFLAVSAFAATSKMDSLTVGAVTYSNVTVLGANATDLYFTHDKGFSNVKLKYLGSDLQKRFNYDPKAAAEAEKKQAELDALYQEALAAKIQAQAEQASRAAKDAARSTEDSLADPVSDQSLLGKAAPPLEVEKWLGEEPVLEGKYVLVTFWEPWSFPCRKLIPSLNSLQKKFAEKLLVVGISSAPESEVTEMEEPKLEFASGVDTTNKVSSAAGVTSIPTVLLLDPKGIVRYQGHPAAITEKKIETLLGKTAD